MKKGLRLKKVTLRNLDDSATNQMAGGATEATQCPVNCNTSTICSQGCATVTCTSGGCYTNSGMVRCGTC